LRKAIKIQVFLLCLVPFIMVLGNSMLIPVLPKIKTAIGIGQFKVGLLITAFSIPAGIVIPFAGILSDQIGRRKVMAPALMLYGIGGITAGLASTLMDNPYYGILTGRIIQGIGAGGTYQLAMATAGDTFTSQERVFALSLLESSNGLGKVVSPILGAAFALIAWFFPFFAYGILAIPISILIFFMIKEKAQFSKQPLENYVNAVKCIFENKALGLGACFFAGMVALFALFGTLSLYSDMLEKNFSIFGLKKGFVLSGPVFLMSLITFLLGIILKKTKNKGLKALILIGLLLILAGQGLFIYTKTMWLLFSALCLVGLGVGLVMTPVNILVTGSCSTKRRGIITCLYGSLRFFGVAVGPPLYGLAESYGLIFVGLLMELAPLVSLLLASFFIDIHRIFQEEKT
jgi:ACDE family multidrug resistance protein